MQWWRPLQRGRAHCHPRPPPSPQLRLPLNPPLRPTQALMWCGIFSRSSGLVRCNAPTAVRGGRSSLTISLCSVRVKCQRFPISPAQWVQHFGAPNRATRQGIGPVGVLRFSVSVVIDFVLSIHGSSAKVREEQQRIANKTQRRQETRLQLAKAAEAARVKARTEAIDAAKAALGAAGLEAKFDSPDDRFGHLHCERIVINLIDQRLRWQYFGTSVISPRPPQQRMKKQLMKQTQLHGVMVQLGMECKLVTSGLGCGWGGCETQQAHSAAVGGPGVWIEDASRWRCMEGARLAHTDRELCQLR